MDELLTFLDELAEKYQFSDEDVSRLENILYAVDDEIYGNEYKDDDEYDISDEEEVYGEEEE